MCGVCMGIEDATAESIILTTMTMRDIGGCDSAHWVKEYGTYSNEGGASTGAHASITLRVYMTFHGCHMDGR